MAAAPPLWKRLVDLAARNVPASCISLRGSVVLVVDSQIHIPMADLRFSFSRSSGPGGQNVNKVNSKVTLHWNVVNSAHLPREVRERFVARYQQRMTVDGDIVVYSQSHRDQNRNRLDCLEKLRQLILSVRHPPRSRRPTRPSRASRERRLREKHHKADKKRQRRRPPSLE
jgi:ribosome-associated protein